MIDKIIGWSTIVLVILAFLLALKYSSFDNKEKVEEDMQKGEAKLVEVCNKALTEKEIKETDLTRNIIFEGIKRFEDPTDYMVDLCEFDSRPMTIIFCNSQEKLDGVVMGIFNFHLTNDDVKRFVRNGGYIYTGHYYKGNRDERSSNKDN